MSNSLESSIVQALIIKGKLETSFESLFPLHMGTIAKQVFGSLRNALESCLSLTPSVRKHQETFLNSVFASIESTSDDLELPSAVLPCKDYIEIEDELLCLSDLFLLIDFENKEREINQCLEKVKGNVVLPILKSDPNLEAYLKD